MSKSRLRSALIVAFHFPPIQGSSGYHRILSFAKYFPDTGWRPRLLTVNPRAYVKSNPKNLELQPEGLQVVRAQGWDAARHLSLFGRYPDQLALPDRWRSWVPFGVAAAKKMIRDERPSVIMSTFPLASAQLIARKVHRETGIPWVADLRDPMVLDSHPPKGRVRDMYSEIEQSIFDEAAAVIVTTPGAAELYRERFPEKAKGKIHVVPNGFDEEVFSGFKRGSFVPVPRKEKLSILHSGLVYREARDPRPLFHAVSRLLENNTVTADDIELVFRASSQDAFIKTEAERYGLKTVVRLEPSISYAEAVDEMLSSDSLLILQSAECNRQIPAKAYEYLRCAKPILAITDPEGDTGKVLSEFDVEDIAAMESQGKVDAAVEEHIAKLRRGDFQFPKEEKVASLARKARAVEATAVLEAVVDS